MNKHHNHILFFITAVLTGLLAACSTDDSTPAGSGQDSSDSVAVHLSIGVRPQTGGNVATRAYTDAHAVDGELMKNWIIIAVQNGKIEKIIQNATAYSAANTEQDEVLTHLAVGETTFYCFANMSLADLGLTATSTTLPDGFDSKTFTVNGNQTAVSGFADGIPMSNKQTVDVEAHTNDITLQVIRMVAKMQLNLYNLTDNDIKVKSVTLTDITANGTGNLYLLPKVQSNSCVPNLSTSATKATYTYTVPGDEQTVAGNTSQTVGRTLTFYVNESLASSPRYFVISLDTQTDGSVETSATHRYALLTWQQIARNDLRVIPIKLDDYQIEFRAEQFAPIGAMLSISESADLVSLQFNWYGQFHLIPWVKRISTGTEYTSVSYADDCWSAVDTQNANIFDTAPAWVTGTQRVEGEMGFTAGTALYRITASITRTDGATELLSRTVQFVMQPASLGAKGARTRSAQAAQWITAESR